MMRLQQIWSDMMFYGNYVAGMMFYCAYGSDVCDAYKMFDDMPQ